MTIFASYIFRRFVPPGGGLPQVHEGPLEPQRGRGPRPSPTRGPVGGHRRPGECEPSHDKQLRRLHGERILGPHHVLRTM